MLNHNAKRKTVRKRRMDAPKIKEIQVHHLNRLIMEGEEDSSIL
jgi:hypothetical protein